MSVCLSVFVFIRYLLLSGLLAGGLAAWLACWLLRWLVVLLARFLPRFFILRPGCLLVPVCLVAWLLGCLPGKLAGSPVAWL